MVNGMCPLSTHVYDQQEEGTCGSISFTDMVQLTLGVSGGAGVPKLSPQTMIDVPRLGGKPSAMRNFICTAAGGLEEEFYNPFINISRQLTTPDFQTPPDRRYRLRAIVRFDDPQLARDVAMRTYVDPVTGEPGALYRPSAAELQRARNQNEPLHAMLVNGISTDHPDPSRHFCVVKNSYGVGWGLHGYSIIPLDFIRVLYVPMI